MSFRQTLSFLQISYKLVDVIFEFFLQKVALFGKILVVGNFFLLLTRRSFNCSLQFIFIAILAHFHDETKHFRSK